MTEHASLVIVKLVSSVNYQYIRECDTNAWTAKQLRAPQLLLWAGLGEQTQHQGSSCCLGILQYPMPGQAVVVHDSSCHSLRHPLLQVNMLLPAQPVTGPGEEYTHV